MAQMSNLLNPKQFSRLRKAIDWSNLQIDFQRDQRVQGIEQFVGSHHTEGGFERPVPVNMLKLAVDIYVRSLAPKSPRGMITTRQREKRALANAFQLALNEIPIEIGYDVTQRRLITEALFSIGILRVGLESVEKVLGEDYGKPFGDLITIDDYVCDMTARHFEELSYEGCNYWVDFDVLKDDDDIKKSVKNSLRPDEYESVGPQGQRRAEEVASRNNSPETFRDQVWVREIFIHKEKLLATYSIKGEKLLKVIDWEGPDHSPYYKLGFTFVPGNLFPLPPVAVWRDLHELGNALFRKLGTQADDQKTVLGFPGGDEDGVLAFQKARDGDGISYSANKPEKLTAGGVEATTLAFYMQVRDLSSYFSGNLDSLGGLAPMTQTVGQDKLLGEAAGAQLRDMADNVIRFNKDVFQAFAWYEWNDPVGSRFLEKKIPGTKLSIPIEWNRDTREGDFEIFDITIDVYSMQDDSPSSKLQKIGVVLSQYVFPLLPAIEAAGGVLDVQTLLEHVARLSDLPELAEIVTWAGPSQLDQQKKSLASGAESSQTREYVHTSRPGATRQGATSNMMQTLMGGGVQESQNQQVSDQFGA